MCQENISLYSKYVIIILKVLLMEKEIEDVIKKVKELNGKELGHYIDKLLNEKDDKIMKNKEVLLTIAERVNGFGYHHRAVRDKFKDMGLNMNASRSYVHKPLAMLFLEKDVEEANKILCSSYIADVDFDNDTYELYWAMPALTTLYYMFGSDGPTEKTLLTSESEAVVVRKLYEFLKRECNFI